MLGKSLKIGVMAFCMCLLVMLTACSYPPPGTASFTLISDQTDKAGRHYVPAGASVEGKDCVTTLFYYLWFGTPPVEETLLSKLLEEHNADALVDAEFKHSFRFFPLIFTRSCLTISGTPVKLRGVP
jgi:hypothetical protein